MIEKMKTFSVFCVFLLLVFSDVESKSDEVSQKAEKDNNDDFDLSKSSNKNSETTNVWNPFDRVKDMEDDYKNFNWVGNTSLVNIKMTDYTPSRLRMRSSSTSFSVQIYICIAVAVLITCCSWLWRTKWRKHFVNEDEESTNRLFVIVLGSSPGTQKQNPYSQLQEPNSEQSIAAPSQSASVYTTPPPSYSECCGKSSDVSLPNPDAYHSSSHPPPY